MFGWLKKRGIKSVHYSKKVIAAEEIKKNALDIKDMASVLLNPNVPESKKESFNEAKRRLNVNDLELIQVYKNYVYSFYVSLGFGFICFALLMKYLFMDNNIMGGIATLSILCICLANSFRFSFRAFQIKHQKLCTVKEWFDRGNEWFPSLK